jgi:hypothetical protein
MNKITHAVKCGNCTNILESPVSLPCGCCICHKHTIDIKGPILCISCEIEYPLPPSGRFPLIKALAEIIDAQIVDIDFGEEHNEAKELCKHLDDLLTNIEDTLKDPYNFTHEAISYLKNTVQLKGEEMKLKIDEQMASLIGKLDKYNEDCKQNLSSSEFVAKSKELSDEKEEARFELEKWLDTLNELKYKEAETERIKNESREIIKKFETKLRQFKIDSLLQKKIGIYRAEIKQTLVMFNFDSKYDFR